MYIPGQGVYDGQWKSDKFDGRGKIFYTSGDYYFGQVIFFKVYFLLHTYEKFKNLIQTNCLGSVGALLSKLLKRWILGWLEETEATNLVKKDLQKVHNILEIFGSVNICNWGQNWLMIEKSTIFTLVS